MRTALRLVLDGAEVWDGGVRRPRFLIVAGALLLALPSCGGSTPPPDRLAPRAAGELSPVAAGAVPPGHVEARGPFRRTGRQVPVFRTAPVTAARLGSSHRAGCPVAVADLRLVTVTHWDGAGGTARGELVVHRDVAASVVTVFRDLYAARFPIAKVRTVERYGADDARSMADDNTSAYNCRPTTGGSGWSEHAFGRAVDINPVENPYVRGSTVLPTAGRAYLDRSRPRPGMITADGPVVRAFAAVGWQWGGHFRTFKDYQHFSRSGR